MGDVSYKLMHILILRNLEKELRQVNEKYKQKLEALDKLDPDFNAKALQLSNQMFDEIREIQQATLKKYEKELEEIHVT